MRGMCLLAVVAAAGSANAAVVFSDIRVNGSLVGGSLPAAIVTTGQNEIDFAFPFPAATVGDPVAPTRAGNIVITFNVDSDTPIDTDVLALLGGVQGSGLILFNEVVEDRTPGFEGIIATSNAFINSNSQLPFTQDIVFSRPTLSFKVKKTLFLSATDTALFDLANVSLIEQRMVPGPGAAVLMALGGLVAARRRR